MKKKEFQQLKSKSGVDLKKMLQERQEKLWTLKVDLASGKVKNARQVRELKRDIARMLTLLKDAN